MDTISLSLDSEARAAQAAVYRDVARSFRRQARAAFGHARDLDTAGEAERARAARIRGCRLQGHADHYAARTRSSLASVAPAVTISLAA